MNAVAPNILQEDFTLLAPPLPQMAVVAHHGLTQVQCIQLGAGVLALAVLAIAWFKWRGRRRAGRAAEGAHLTALRELAAWRELSDEGRYREAVVAISGTLRRYVEQRYGVRAASATSEEFWEEQRTRSKIPKTHDPFWEHFISSGDLIKYAGVAPEPFEFRRLFTESVQFVESSYVQPTDAA